MKKKLCQTSVLRAAIVPKELHFMMVNAFQQTLVHATIMEKVIPWDLKLNRIVIYGNICNLVQDT